MVKAEIISNLLTALANKFESLSNKKDTINDGTNPNDTTHYPTVNAVKNYFVKKESGKSLTSNDFSDAYKTKLDSVDAIVDNALSSTSSHPVENKVIKDALDSKADSSSLKTVATSGSYTDLTDKPIIDSSLDSNSTNAVQNKKVVEALNTKTDDSSLAAVAKSGSYNDLDDTPTIPPAVTIDSSLSTSSENPVQNKIVKGALDLKANSSDLATVATTGDYDDLIDKPTLSDLGGVVTVEKQTTAETGYLATYHVKQNDTKVGASINIPKDFLVKSASLETCSTVDTPVQGYSVGDKYFDFIINTKDNSGSNEHLYCLVTDLIDTYTADNTTLSLSNNQFSVASGGIGSTQLTSAVNTSLGYADAYHSSPASSITSTDVTNWNNKTTTSQVDAEIESYLEALIEVLDPTNSS